jgi:predicted NAD/FAD-dependent oxidoreductase
VAPAYAPPGAALVSANTVGVPDLDDAKLVDAVREQLSDWFGGEVRRWRHLRTYRIAVALPDRTAPAELRLPVRLRPGRYVCGDHREHGSVEGAMASGWRAAQAALEDLHARRI